MPFKDFSPTVLSSADVNTYLMNQSVMTFANASARSSALTAPVEGMVTYLEDTNKAYQYDGANWLEIVKFDSAGRYLNSNQPAWYAYKTISNMANAQIISFDTASVNVGNHFGNLNTTNARFTCPVAGLYYVFYGSIGVNSNDVFRHTVWKNGIQISESQLRVDTTATGTEYAPNSARGFLVSCSANDYLQIYIVADAGSVIFAGSGYAYFGGWLIG